RPVRFAHAWAPGYDAGPVRSDEGPEPAKPAGRRDGPPLPARGAWLSKRPEIPGSVRRWLPSANGVSRRLDVGAMEARAWRLGRGRASAQRGIASEPDAASAHGVRHVRPRVRLLRQRLACEPPR